MSKDIFTFAWSIFTLAVGIVIVVISFTVPQPKLFHTFVLALGGGMLIGRSIMEMRYA